MSIADPDPIPAPAKPAYTIPPQNLRDMVLTLLRPPADAPETAWQGVVQGGLDRLEALDPRDALQTMLAVTVIATQAGAVDACRPRRSRRTPPTPRRCRRCASGRALPRCCA